MKPTKSRFVTFATVVKPGIFALFFLSCIVSSCKTVKKEPERAPKEPVHISRRLNAKGQLTADQLAGFFIHENPQKDLDEIYAFAVIYIEEAATENINSDFAFAQMCHETGFLRFGGLVQPQWHNYCGLGAISAEQPGCQFETQRLGVRAHIQHIQAYATTEDVKLNNELVDPRYSWVHKTKYAVTIEELAASWATDPEYGQKLEGLLTRMEAFVNN